MIKNLKTLLCMLMIIFISSCTYNIKVDPNPKIEFVGNKYSQKLGIFIDESELSQVYNQGGFCLVGAAHTWVVPVGEALKTSTYNSFTQIFKEVESVKSLNDFKNNSIIIIFNPKVKQFTISQTITTEFYLKATIINQKDKVIYEKEFKGETNSSAPFMRAFCLGFFGGQTAFSDSVNKAFENAFEKLFQDMLQTVDFNNI